MRNSMENFIVNGISNNREQVAYQEAQRLERIANPVQLSDKDKNQIAFDRAQREVAKKAADKRNRKPIFNRFAVKREGLDLSPKLGDMIAFQAMQEQTRRDMLWAGLMQEFNKEVNNA